MKNYKFFSAQSLGRGRVEFRLIVNFLLLAKLLLGVIAIAAIAGGIYGAYLVLGTIFSFLWSIKFWLLGALLLGLLIWGLTKIKLPVREKKPRTEDTEEKKNFKKFFFWVGILTAFVAAMFLLTTKGCKSTPQPQSTEIAVTPEEVQVKRFIESFNWTVTSRAYLDGVQQNVENHRALVGFKFINGQKVDELQFEGKTYEEAIAIVRQDWQELVLGNLNGVNLSEQQLTVITLFAMRNGKYGFLKSEFLHQIQAGNIVDAAKFMAIHKASGEKRSLGPEAKQYLWILKNMWDNNLTVQELLDFPILSYKSLGIEKLYDKNGVHIFTEDMKNTLKKGYNPTARKALGL